MPHCQICGRKKNLKKDGTIALHHVQGNACEGSHHAPIEKSDRRLADLVRTVRNQSQKISAHLQTLRDRRTNWIDPALVAQDAALWLKADKLDRRLKRHRSWPARFEKEMATRGYGTPPPDYLIEEAI